MQDDARDEEMARIMRGFRIAPPPPVARPAARRANPFEAAPIHAPRFAPPAARRQGTKRKYDRMLAGYGKKRCPVCGGIKI
jgi:hypothetical protein